MSWNLDLPFGVEERQAPLLSNLGPPSGECLQCPYRYVAWDPPQSSPTRDPWHGGCWVLCHFLQICLGDLDRVLCPLNATLLEAKEHILASLLEKCNKPKDLLGLLGLAQGPTKTLVSHVSSVCMCMHTRACRQVRTDWSGRACVTHTLVIFSLGHELWVIWRAGL